MDGSIVVHFDEKDDMENPDDILSRRLKNRERQRRYRAKKKHEADMRNSLIVTQSTPLHYQQMPTEFLSTPMQVDIPVQVEGSVNASSTNCPTRVHCARDWKKDARRAHIHKKQDVRSNEPFISETTPPGGSQKPSWQSGVKADQTDSNGPTVDGNGTQKLTSSRRHWKAEARNKKNSE